MDLLDNELVRKYFENEYPEDRTPPTTALRILRAMQEPIKKGERYLWCDGNKDTKERTWEYPLPDLYDEEFHPNHLRLPGRFQKQEKCDCWCHKGQYCCECKNTFGKPTPELEKYDPLKLSEYERKQGFGSKPKDEVEEKIIEIEKCIPSSYIFGVVEKKLRELVEMARKTNG